MHAWRNECISLGLKASGAPSELVNVASGAPAGAAAPGPGEEDHPEGERRMNAGEVLNG